MTYITEDIEQAPSEPTNNVTTTSLMTTLSIDTKPITWAETKNIILTDNDSETGGPSHANETLGDFLEEIGAMPEDQSAEPSILTTAWAPTVLSRSLQILQAINRLSKTTSEAPFVTS